MNNRPAASSKDVLSGYIDRSWRFLAELQPLMLPELNSN
jgi:hypothetical protein